MSKMTEKLEAWDSAHRRWEWHRRNTCWKPEWSPYRYEYVYRDHRTGGLVHYHSELIVGAEHTPIELP